MRFVFTFLTVIFLSSAAAQAENAVKFSPEFSAIQKVYESMSPEQRADVLRSAKKVQAQLEQMSEADRRKLYREALGAQKDIDIGAVDVQKLDTSKSLSVGDIKDLMDSAK